jgi:hypothetical protein
MAHHHRQARITGGLPIGRIGEVDGTGTDKAVPGPSW